MLDGIFHLIQSRPWTEVLVDVLDLFLVSYIVYRVLLVMRGTRAMQIGVGLGVVLLVYFISKWAGLVTLFNLLSYLLSSLILVVVVVFQSDIRRGLMRVGSRAVFSSGNQQQETKLVEEVVNAATELARHRMGAIICFEQEANLDEFVASGGTPIDAVVQRDLLVSLFVPEGVNKLHDGAVIIRNLRIALAGVFFPMPETKSVDKSLGTRHRAAMGVSDETDAVVVVVSEERGTISVCFNGNIIPNLDGMTLKQALLGLLGDKKKKKKSAARVVAAIAPPPAVALKKDRLPTPTPGARIPSVAGADFGLSKSGEKPAVRIPSVAGAKAVIQDGTPAPEKAQKPQKAVPEPVTMPMQASLSTTQLPIANVEDDAKDDSR